MKKSEIKNYPKGSVLEFTAGMYSDFRVITLLVAIKDCNLPELANQFWQSEKERIAAEKQEWPDAPECNDFPAWLITNGYAMPVEYSPIYLGDGYGFDSSFGVKE